jgi:hypothetical protein
MLRNINTKLPVTPKTNGHQQAVAEPDLGSLLPTTTEPPKYAMNQGDERSCRSLT